MGASLTVETERHYSQDAPTPLPPQTTHESSKIFKWTKMAAYAKEEDMRMPRWRNETVRNPWNKFRQKCNIPPVISCSPDGSSGWSPSSGTRSAWSAIVATKQLFSAVRVTVVKPKHNHQQVAGKMDAVTKQLPQTKFSDIYHAILTELY